MTIQYKQLKEIEKELLKGISIKKLGDASYVGLMLKKPTISVSIKLNYGIIKNNDVYFKEEIRGKILKTKEFANPIFISPGHNIDINTSLDITKEISTGVKLPIPLFLAHKKIIKLRDEINNKI